MPPKNTKVVYTISDVRDAMSTLLFATTSSSYCKGYVSNSVRFNDEYVQYPFTRRNNVSSILYTNDLDMVNFLFDDFANPARGGQNFLKEYGVREAAPAMRMLYTVAAGSGGNPSDQIAALVEKNMDLYDQTRREADADRLAGLYTMFLIPSVTGMLKLAADMTMFMLTYFGTLARLGS